MAVRQPTNCRYFSSLRIASPGFSATAELLVFVIRDLVHRRVNTSSPNGPGVAFLTAVREVLGSNRAVGSCLS